MHKKQWSAFSNIGRVDVTQGKCSSKRQYCVTSEDQHRRVFCAVSP